MGVPIPAPPEPPHVVVETIAEPHSSLQSAGHPTTPEMRARAPRRLGEGAHPTACVTVTWGGPGVGGPWGRLTVHGPLLGFTRARKTPHGLYVFVQTSQPPREEAPAACSPPPPTQGAGSNGAPLGMGGSLAPLSRKGGGPIGRALVLVGEGRRVGEGEKAQMGRGRYRATLPRWAAPGLRSPQALARPLPALECHPPPSRSRRLR